MRLPLTRVALVLLALAVAVSGCSSVDSGPQEPKGSDSSTPSPTATATPTTEPGPIAPEFFGMHDADPVGDSWPEGPVGSLRVWDSGVVWNQVETAPGVYDFSRLDAIVASAREHDARTLIVLGQTPAFHSTTPDRVGSYGAGAASMPDLGAWTSYLRAVVKRYAGDDVDFQVWNETNVEGYWNGTPAEMAQLTAAAREVVDELAPSAVLVAPAMAVRNIGQRVGLQKFYAEEVDGVPVADLVDVVSLQLYPEAGLRPERSLDLLEAARRLLAGEGVPADKPIWDTEINYGLLGGEPATSASLQQQQANVALTFLLNAGAGIERVYWYSWDLHVIADTDLTEADNVTTTAAGDAFATVHRWLLGSTVQPCTGVGKVWQCALTTPDGPATVYWAAGRRPVTVTTAADAATAETLGEDAVDVEGGATLEVGVLPVLVRSEAAANTTGLP